MTSTYSLSADRTCSVSGYTIMDRNSESLGFEKDGRKVEFSFRKCLIINLIGVSGSGKGSHGEMFSKRYGIPHFSIGDIYREAMLNSSTVGKYNKISNQLIAFSLGDIFSIFICSKFNQK